MQIYPKNTGPLRPDITRTSQPADVSDRGSVQPIGSAPSASDRSDKVQISDAGRALAARGERAGSAGLDPARADAIRGRILSGAYDTLQVVDAVARRLLDTGDL
ncbi:MAG: Anti-sigma-28 factor FlgM family protein [Gemmatimonadetes bacterium]|jgi:negative regulator of flagellin synthesis FlgM|nr:Anti-sigma-28 factor FlgM family protein [Gemmatimonadota bacterium]